MTHNMNIISNRTERKVISQMPHWPVISVIILTIYFSMLYFPQFEALLPTNYITLACFLVWCALSFINDPGYYFNIKSYVLLSFVFYAFSIVIPIVCGYVVIANRYASLPLLSLGYIIYDYYKVHNQTRYLKKAFIIPSVFAIITAFVTYNALTDNSYIVRIITSLGSDAKEYYAEGICGYSFVYGVVTALPLFLYLFLKVKNKFLKIANMAVFVFLIMFIVKANFLTAFLVTIISSVVLLSGYLFKKSRKNIIYILLIILIVVLFVVNYSTILTAIENHIPRRIAAALFDSSGDSVIESVYADFNADRVNTITKSLEVIVKNPLFGVLGSGEIDTSGDFLTGFGQHSHILDTFALYGVLIGILCVFVIILPIVHCNKKRNTDVYFTVAIAVNALLILLFNNATESIAISYCILFPLIRDTFEQKPVETVVVSESQDEDDDQDDQAEQQPENDESDIDIEFDPSVFIDNSKQMEAKDVVPDENS